jgi:hypothetical protein
MGPIQIIPGISRKNGGLGSFGGIHLQVGRKKTLGFGDDIFGDTFIYNRHEP